MAKPIFTVVDIPPDAKADQVAALLNGPSDDGYSFQQLTPTRAVFKLPARRVNGRWVCDGG
jgi:hypothetical protein